MSSAPLEPLSIDENYNELDPNVALMDIDMENGDNSSRNIFSIIWKHGKLGAAFYNQCDKLLYVYEEMVDLAPQFLGSRTLHREINPFYTITLGNRSDDFIKILIDTINGQDDATMTSDSVRMLPKNLYMIPIKDYPFEVCKNALLELTLGNMSSEMPEAKKLLYIQSLVNFDYKMSVHAAGALVKYLEKNWAYFSPFRGELQYLHIQQVSVKKHVLMDWTSFNAFQIFHQRSHEANFKRGLQSSSREGLSLFKLFSTNCKSKIGQNCLRELLLQPIKDMDELNKRLDFIQFVLNPLNREFVESLRDNIKEICDVHKVFSKISNMRANNRDWFILHKTLYRILFINELSAPYREESCLINELNIIICPDLDELEKTIYNALDFSGEKRSGRPVIKFGLDESLDAKKLRRQDIAKHVTAAARVAVYDLPDFLNECSVIYLPEMGHMIAVKEWEPNCDPQVLQGLGFQFMFTLHGMVHYKNPLCIELDNHLGDLNAEIIAHENRILQRLSGFVLKYNNEIRKPLKLIAFIDSLISMASVAHSNNYVRPVLNDENTHRIIEGRHPLMELVSEFETNDFISGGENPHIKILTGPNGSGKSIYLKQVGLIIYLAHVGSFVPAKEAYISMVDSFHSRMQASESISVRLSAFMIDISLATQALHNARSSSLVILDEFGRGTLGEDAITLLTCAVKYFMNRGQYCPHILVSTHFQNITKFLPETHLLQHLKMTHTVKDGILLFLYKVAPGVAESLAFEIAQGVGLDEELISRAKEMYQSLRGSGDTMLMPLVQRRGYPSTSTVDEQFLRNVYIPAPDVD